MTYGHAMLCTINWTMSKLSNNDDHSAPEWVENIQQKQLRLASYDEQTKLKYLKPHPNHLDTSPLKKHSPTKKLYNIS